MSLTAGLVHRSGGSSVAMQGGATCCLFYSQLPVLSTVAKVMLSNWPCLLQRPVGSPSGTAGCCRRGIAADGGRPLAALLVTASAWEEGAGFRGCHPVCG